MFSTDPTSEGCSGLALPGVSVVSTPKDMKEVDDEGSYENVRTRERLRRPRSLNSPRGRDGSTSTFVQEVNYRVEGTPSRLVHKRIPVALYVSKRG